MRRQIQCPIAVLQEIVLPHMLSDDCMNSKPVLSLQSRRISAQAGKSTVKDLHNVLVRKVILTHLAVVVAMAVVASTL